MFILRFILALFSLLLIGSDASPCRHHHRLHRRSLRDAISHRITNITSAQIMDDGGLLPDFVPDAGYLAETLSLGFVNADADPCLVNEGCLSGPGMRRVLRFGTMIHNRGPVDAVLGQPPAEISPNNPAYWHYDTCHQHWHFTAYAAYTLLKADQQTVKLIGSKTGFCLEDFHCPTRSMKKYHCDNQGITAGCADVYDDTLPCQWIDVTEIWEREREVFDGRRREVFWLKVAVNGQGVFPEREVGNNVVMVKVDFAAIGEYQGEE